MVPILENNRKAVGFFHFTSGAALMKFSFETFTYA